MSKNYNKEETIKRHREIWNWIADQVESGVIDLNTFDSLNELKAKAIQVLHPEDKNEEFRNCYLCDYAARQLHYYIVTLNPVCGEICGRYHCYYCPLGYGETPNPSKCLNHLYEDAYDFFGFAKSHDHTEFVKLAREIANLPERNFNDS